MRKGGGPQPARGAIGALELGRQLVDAGALPCVRNVDATLGSHNYRA